MRAISMLARSFRSAYSPLIFNQQQISKFKTSSINPAVNQLLIFPRHTSPLLTTRLFATAHETNGMPSEAGKAPESEQSPEQQSDQPELSEREKQLQEENAKLIEKVSLIDDKYKRSLADQENLRNRMSRQIEDAKVFGIQNFSKDLLEVADILNKALESVPKEAINGNEALKSLFEGVSMTEKQLQTIFRRHGIMQINPIGEKFNPNEHHALFETAEANKEPGTVSVVTKIGYKLKERTIRPAQVGVVKQA